MGNSLKSVSVTHIFTYDLVAQPAFGHEKLLSQEDERELEIKKRKEKIGVIMKKIRKDDGNN
jgi:hypothetical protein